MAERVEGYIKGSTTKNALEAAKKAPLPPKMEEDSSDIEIDEEDARESQDDDQNQLADEMGKTIGEATSTNFGATRRMMGGLGLGAKETRKAPTNTLISRKSRFPMIVKPDCMS